MTTRIVGITVHQNSSTGSSWICTPIVFGGAPFGRAKTMPK